MLGRAIEEVNLKTEVYRRFDLSGREGAHRSRFDSMNLVEVMAMVMTAYVMIGIMR